MRADLYLFENGFAKSRSRAETLIKNGSVSVDGTLILKPSFDISDGEHEIVISSEEKFVSRGGLKLEAALETFKIDVTGFTALDIGASTGGFTDCLLSRGATFVTALDVGQGQLDEKLKNDPRVKSIEKYNARDLSPDVTDKPVDIVVMDVSFISQTLIIPKVPAVLKDGGVLVSLIKPQFEAGRAALGKGGVVKSEKDRSAAVKRVTDAADAAGLELIGVMRSPIKGGDGNIEFLACFKKDKQIPEKEILYEFCNYHEF